jgi:hypothetical protein
LRHFLWLQNFSVAPLFSYLQEHAFFSFLICHASVFICSVICTPIKMEHIRYFHSWPCTKTNKRYISHKCIIHIMNL